MIEQDPTHIPGPPDIHWTTDNVGEALPGVTTPLGWTIWADAGDRMIRETMYALGIYDARERVQPEDPADRLIQPFHGRVAIRVEWLASVGDRMPGTTGPEAVTSMLGRIPDTLTFHPTRRRYPAVAARLPYVAATAPRRLRVLASETQTWWRGEIRCIGLAEQAEATRRFQRAHARFEHVMTLHTMALMSALTPLLQAVTNLVQRTGVGSVGAFSGPGGAEMAIIGDIWRASRGEIGIADVIAAHGYHGPLEGEISSRVWREEPQPLHHLVEGYRGTSDAENPLLREEEARRRLPGLQRELVAQLPRAQRAPAMALLRYAARTLPLRGVGKASFLQALDVARAGARRIGVLLAERGALDDPDDVFYLTTTELARVPEHARDLVAQRRRNRHGHQQLILPASWRGTPDVQAAAPDADDATGLITGIGVSAGTSEGPVRVVTDPSFTDVEPGEVLVAPTTDPSWASIMFLSSALVVDIGGALSHAAVVARELGIPCVVNTRTGTRTLRNGDVVRVDGGAGTIELLKRGHQPGGRSPEV